jgi:hypothetical protein
MSSHKENDMMMNKVGRSSVVRSVITIEGVKFNNLSLEDVGAEGAFIARPTNKEGWYVILEDESYGFVYRRSVRLGSRKEAVALAIASSSAHCEALTNLVDMCNSVFLM